MNLKRKRGLCPNCKKEVIVKEIIKNKVMTEEDLTNVFKYIVKKCDMLINNDDYEADAYAQDTVEDIAELCNNILDGKYGKLVELKEVDLNKEIDEVIHNYKLNNNRHTSICAPDIEWIAKHFFELGLKNAKGE